MVCRKGKLVLVFTGLLGVSTFACAQEGRSDRQRTQKIASWMARLKKTFSRRQVVSDSEEVHKRGRRVLQRLGVNRPAVSLEEQAARSFPTLQTLVVHTLADMIHQEGPRGYTWKQIRDSMPAQFIQNTARTYFALFFRDDRYRSLRNRDGSPYQIRWTAVDAWQAGLIKVPDDGKLIIDYAPLTPCEKILYIPGIQRVTQLCIRESPWSVISLLMKFREIRFNFLVPPPDIGYLANLQQLIIRAIPIKQLPSSIGRLENLRVLDICGTSLIELPSEIGQLKNLRWLRVQGSYCNCGFYNEKVRFSGRCHCDCGSYLQKTPLTLIPDSIGQLKKLRIFILIKTGVKELPETVVELGRLCELDLSDSCIQKLPDRLGKLQSLKLLNLRHSAIAQIPDSIGQLKQLVQLDVAQTRVAEFPKSIDQLSGNLRVLHTQGSLVPRKKIDELRNRLPNTKI